jgi:UDP-N-acetyl-D-mannosaminuronic acid transferase (WecB/TagA/CpsF family)
MQLRGLEWLFRLAVEPRRLWCRYALTNSAYLLCVGLQATGLFDFDTDGRKPAAEMLYG